MNHPFGMCLGQALSHLAGEEKGLSEVELPSLDEIVERAPFGQLHDNPIAFVRFKNVVNLDDGPMIELRHRVGLAPQTATDLGIFGGLRMDMFDGDVTVESILVYDQRIRYLVRLEEDSRGWELLKVGRLGGELFPADDAAALRWLAARNADLPFAGSSPLDRMLRGSIDDLYAVRRYIDGWRGLWP